MYDQGSSGCRSGSSSNRRKNVGLLSTSVQCFLNQRGAELRADSVTTRLFSYELISLGGN